MSVPVSTFVRLMLFVFPLLLFCGETPAVRVDDSPPEVDDWGFRPDENGTVRLNPPGFTWRPVEGASAYRFQVSSSSSFEHLVYQCESTPWSSHCPSWSWEPGRTYYWRYAAADVGGTWSEWSRARSFFLPEDAVSFPKPSPRQLMERIPKEHPRLLFTSSDLPRLRELAKGDLSSLWKAIVTEADRVLEDPPDITDPPKYPEEMEPRGKEWKAIWWGNRRRVQAVLESASTLGFLYQITGNREYGNEGRKLLLAFCQWDPHGSTQYDYNDEAAMPALYLASRAYSWVHDLLSDGEKAKVIAVMRERGRQVFDHLRRRKQLWRPYSSHSNRAWHFLGELAIAFMDDIPEARTWLDYALTIFYTCYPVWGDTDGGWHEGVPYWFSYLGRFGYWILAMDSGLGIDVFRRPFFRETGYFGLYMLPPGTEHAGFGDQSPKKNLDRGAGPTMALLAVGSGNPHLLWYAEQVNATFPKTYIGFLWAARRKGLRPEPPSKLPSSRCFRGVGISVFNTNLLDGKRNVQMFFKSSPLGTRSHGYNANNSFHLNVFGKPLLQNTGRRDIHRSPHHRHWMWETKSQNAILVNGKGQFPHSPNALGEILNFQTSADLDLVVGEAGRSYEDLERWTRTVLFLKPDLFVLHDVLCASSPSTIEWLVHAPTRFRIEDNSGFMTATVETDGASVTLEFLTPRNLSVTQTNGYDPPPADWVSWKIDEWHLSARPPQTGKKFVFVTILRVNGRKRDYRFEELETDAGERVRRFRFEDGTRIDFSPDRLVVFRKGRTRDFACR